MWSEVCEVFKDKIDELCKKPVLWQITSWYKVLSIEGEIKTVQVTNTSKRKYLENTTEAYASYNICFVVKLYAQHGIYAQSIERISKEQYEELCAKEIEK